MPRKTSADIKVQKNFEFKSKVQLFGVPTKCSHFIGHKIDLNKYTLLRSWKIGHKENYAPKNDSSIVYRLPMFDSLKKKI